MEVRSSAARSQPPRVGRPLVRAIDERAKPRVRIRRASDGLVRKDELAELAVVVRLGRLHRRLLRPSGSGHGVGVERGLEHAAAAGPEAVADHFVRYASRMKAGPSRGGAGRPEKRVTARSKPPQKKCTGLHLPMKARAPRQHALGCDEMRQGRLALRRVV